MLRNWILLLYYVYEAHSAIYKSGPEIVPRADWGARPPTKVDPMKNPVPFVVIHHSYMPAPCDSKEGCVLAMRWMQDLHQLNNSWNDIGYSFAAGGDSRIYTGRGWSAIGAHAPKYNDKSIGICLIGDWQVKLPPGGQMTAVKQLIQKGVNEGFIQEDYKLIGHRQVKDTVCPGDALYKEIQTWPHWVEDPTAKSGILKEGSQPEPREKVDFPDEKNKFKRSYARRSLKK